ncbi:MAG TPA: hypothetical protein VL286_06235 [Rhizomicrobium sp.]|jgi:hypothetical protein|nr:hypothetical protein [Rhizomicrobium sp.]
MVAALQALTLLLVAITMALALAHALEFPGKLRLPKETYFAVQTIYYPGFTIGGVAEVLALAALLALVIVMPKHGAPFALTVSAFAMVVVLHGLYWLVTHPVNEFWLKEIKLYRASGRFFGLTAAMRPLNWTALRDRWEYSHIVRAALALLSLVLLTTASVLAA